jgi:hypothetical protein
MAKAKKPAKITVTNLKGKSDKQIGALLKKVKTSRIGFIIRNAPFKV